jgi:hypothetical protein
MSKFVLIQSVTVGSGGAASIEFGSIPQTYTDLLLVASLRSTTTSSNVTEYDVLAYRFNSSASGYTHRNIEGSGSSAASATYTTVTASIGGTYGRITDYGVNNALSGTSIFSSSNLYIPNYTGSTNKSFSFENVQERNATAASMEMVAGLWSNTAAITTITLALGSGNFAQYSSASLYGIKNS